MLSMARPVPFTQRPGVSVNLAEDAEPCQPFRPCWPNWKNGDFRPVDRAIVEVPVAEELLKTKRGLWRPESGVVRYSAQHWVKFRADAEELLYIMRNQVPVNCRDWSLGLLHKAYRSSCRRYGSWDRFNLCLHDFIALFPRTFELFGLQEQLVRPLRSTVSSVADGEAEVMKRLAMAKELGFIHAQTPVNGGNARMSAPTPAIVSAAAKACYIPSRSTSRRSSARTSYASRPTSATSSYPSRPASRPTSRPVSAQTRGSPARWPFQEGQAVKRLDLQPTTGP
mmetsp:Transcript_6468/g.14851  ORF Transcript_6468/g.14851 Transcript_6468/m.14851 type:complete len:282 (-) Transcript_6468:190-1035(-)